MRVRDGFGWGVGAVDPDPPIPDGAGAQRCRALAFRVAVELLADARLGVVVDPLFTARDDAGPGEVLARLLHLLRALIDRELPRLGRALRGECATRERWQRAPSGGRVDAAASVCAALLRSGRADPDLWLVRRAERLMDTPVNRLLAAILHDVAALLRAALLQGGEAPALLRGERSLLSCALGTLRDFLAASPLGEVPPPREGAAALFVDAARRRAELSRFAGLIAWWRALRETKLAALREVSAPGVLADLTPAACYELSCAFGLVLALGERFVAEPPGSPGAFAFRAPGGVARVTFGAGAARPHGRRAFTASLELPSGTLVMIEARNASPDAAADLAERLHLACEAAPGRRRAYLLTPAPAPATNPSSPLRARPFLAGLTAGGPADPVTEWSALLDDLFLTTETAHAP